LTDVSTPISDEFFHDLDAIVRRDPGKRGPASYRCADGPIAHGGLEAAAKSLARDGRSVGIVTGFCVEGPKGFTAETDGPPGALFLARVLTALGIDVTIIGDLYAMPTLLAGCRHLGMSRDMLLEFPFDADDAERPSRQSFAPDDSRRSLEWIDRFLSSGLGNRWSHLIAIERCGPSRLDRGDRCYNMRAEDITSHTAKTHLLFEAIAARRLPIVTIGLADGGNEIGMGSLSSETLREACASPHGATIACRIATDHLIVAGVSNWAAYALAAAVCRLRGRLDVLAPMTPSAQAELIRVLVSEGGAVDGVTRLAEPTVDGLPQETYLQALVGILKASGAA
jgi:hypothetical protein